MFIIKGLKGIDNMDRRIQKTRHAIMNTFMEIMSEKKFEKITINEIAERANINRGTIYLHYIDKYDLLDKCIETYIAQLVQHCNEKHNGNESPTNTVLRGAFEHLQDNFDYYKVLLTNEGVPLFRNQLYKMISQILNKEVSNINNTNDISMEVKIQFLTSAIVGVLEWWVVNLMPISIDEISEQLWSLVESNYVDFLPEKN